MSPIERQKTTQAALEKLNNNRLAAILLKSNLTQGNNKL